MAYAIPSLWSRIHLGPHQLIESEPFLQRFLDRARTHPLHISIRATEDSGGDWDTACTTLSARSTIYYLDISTDTLMLAYLVLHSFNRVLPSLLDLALEVDDCDDITPPEADILLDVSPVVFHALRSLSLPQRRRHLQILVFSQLSS
jgi:hypothetical protein